MPNWSLVPDLHKVLRVTCLAFSRDFLLRLLFCTSELFVLKTKWKLADCSHRDVVLILCKATSLGVRLVNRTLKNNIHSELSSVSIIC